MIFWTIARPIPVPETLPFNLSNRLKIRSRYWGLIPMPLSCTKKTGIHPASAANILWCFGLHDRPWPARPVFGAVRSMTRAGMERKTDVGAYIREIAHLERTGKELTA